MKNLRKMCALLLAAIICFSCLSNLSVLAAKTVVNTATTNNDFAKMTAEIIKNEDDSSMLRIIGKFEKKPSVSVFETATEAVISKDGRFVLQFSSEKKLVSCLEALKNNPDIIYAERDRPIYTSASEGDSEFLSWGVEAIEADIYAESIASSVSGRSVTVAIVDSGAKDIDFLKEKLIPGYDFTDNVPDSFKDESSDSHGTFLSSIVADCTRNVPVKIMPVRVLKSKTGSLINAVNGIIYAADNGADVINLSLGGVIEDCSPLEDAVAYAEEKNVSVVVCAGNTKCNIRNFCPAHIESAITVSSVNNKSEFSESFSNYGQRIDLAAPGESIAGYNASGELTSLTGTSMSAAFVSAAAAMYRLANPLSTAKQVQDSLTGCAKDLGEEGWDEKYGYGVPKLSDLINTEEIPVETVSLPQSTYSLSVGDTLEIDPVFSPENATDKSYVFSADNANISINGNIITAVSAGITTLTVTCSNGIQTTAEITISEKIPEITAVLKIRNNNGNRTINYGETLRLTAEITERPENTFVWWFVNEAKAGEGEIFEVSPESGSVEVSAKLVDADGTVIINSDGNEISDKQTVSVKSGFFQKIISFFKNLFRLDRTVVQFFKFK